MRGSINDLQTSLRSKREEASFLKVCLTELAKEGTKLQAMLDAACMTKEVMAGELGDIKVWKADAEIELRGVHAKHGVEMEEANCR